MKKFLKVLLAALVCLAFNQTRVFASSHREAPLIAFDPLADNTDLYAFRSPCDSSKVILIANYIPFEHPAGGPNWYTFGSDVRYEIHIKNNTSTTGDDIIYRFMFKSVDQDPTTFFNIRLGKQNLKTTYTCSRSIDGGNTFANIVTNGVVPPPNIGPRSIENATVGLGAANYDALMTAAITTATSGERVFCGPIDDPFFVDLGGAFDVGNFRLSGRDGLAKFNCHSICIEVPIATLQKNGQPVTQAKNILDPNYIIGVYASASRPQITTFDSTGGLPATSGNWIQVSRLGMPLTNEVVIPIGSKDLWNATLPTDDLQFAKFFKNPELALYMDDSEFGTAVPGLDSLRIQSNSLGSFDFRNYKKGLWPLKGTAAVKGTALDDAQYGTILLPDSMSPRAVDLLPIFYTGVPNEIPYQLATGKNGNPLAAGKPFINNFLPTLGDMLRLNMAVPATPRGSSDFSSLGIVQAAVLGLTDNRFAGSDTLQWIPNMDGFPNGRRLEDDVTTIELQAVSGVALAAIGLWYDDYKPGGSPVTADLVRVLTFNAGVTHNDTTFKACFPYVQSPWRGFNGPGYIGPTNTLPVSWTLFTATKEGQEVGLNWQVADEINNDHFEVERKILGSEYSTITTVQASKAGLDLNIDAYQAIDPHPSLQQPNFYRIKQVNKDGSFTYSPIRMIQFNGINGITISPNPASNFINITTTQTVQIVIYDAIGRRLLSTTIGSGTSKLNISSFAKGIYTIVAENNGIRVDTKKVAVP